MLLMKRCAKCLEQKLEDQFGNNKSRKDGLNEYCRSCAYQIKVDYYKTPKGIEARRRRAESQKEQRSQRLERNHKSAEENRIRREQK